MSHLSTKKKVSRLSKIIGQYPFFPCLQNSLKGVCFQICITTLSQIYLITKNQSGIRPGDSVTNQLIFLVDKMHSSLDINLEVRSVFLDMSKAFDKVWHEGLLFKLRQNGINGKLMNLLKSYLSNRKQRVLINGSESDWGEIESGVPQGSVLGLLLLLIYINDLEIGIKSHSKFFADDTSLFPIVRDPNTSACELNHDLKLISQ